MSSNVLYSFGTLCFRHRVYPNFPKRSQILSLIVNRLHSSPFLERKKGRDTGLSKSRSGSKDGQPPSQSDSSSKKKITSIFKPIPYKSSSSEADAGVGKEIAGELEKAEVLKILSEFARKPEIKAQAAENGLDSVFFPKVYASFRKFCVQVESLPVDLHIILKDISQGAGHPDDLYPYFYDHAIEVFPHIICMEDLKKISDLRYPANWYPEARSSERKIIYHAGPTNSGKTYHALQRFFEAKSGVYCSPLKLLANEVYHKSIAAGTPCDLITGEERRYFADEDSQAAHVACTIEMADTSKKYEVAVIDEIQMIRDPVRGGAWTKAVLGLHADEVHICGEGAAIDLVKDLMVDTGDEVEVRRYKRLTKLTYLDHSIENLENIKPGDCIVCFNKNDIYKYCQELEQRGIKCAVIYGHLPPGTKMAEAAKFNDPNDPCKVMIATDAIGMGLNLCIKRIIFNTLIKPTRNEKGEKEMNVVTTSQALQIAGRAGRFGSGDFAEGEATTFRQRDLQLLQNIVREPVEPITQAGLNPTADQIELFAYHLPNATLSNLMDIFETISQLDSDKFFMCDTGNFKFLADMIEHVPLSLKMRYTFCCAPISRQADPFICTTFLQFARKVSRGEPLTFKWLCKQMGWPFKHPNNLTELVHLEVVHDCLDLYLWLRFMDMFPHVHQVRDIQNELDHVIQEGVFAITNLLQNASKTKHEEVVHRRKKTDVNMASRTIVGSTYKDDDIILLDSENDEMEVSDVNYNDDTIDDSGFR